MITYYASLIQDGMKKITVPFGPEVEVPAYKTDPAGLVVGSIYKGERKQPGDVLLAQTATPLAAYERLTRPGAAADWVLAGGKLVPCFAKLKAAKLAAAEAQYAKELADGITINGLTLAAAESDRNAFSQLLGMLATAEALLAENDREAFRDSSQVIADAAGATHQMTVTQLRQSIVGYGQAIQQGWIVQVQRRAAIAAATTTEELNAA